MKRLDNKVAVVTGAAHGIGRAIAKVFANEGAQLALFDLDINELNVLKTELVNADVAVQISELSIADSDAVSYAIKEVVNNYGRIDILINNAGVNSFHEPISLSKSDWDHCMAVNLEGAWNCSRTVLPHMLERSYGHIVNIASVHSHKIIRRSFPYGVAKHGLIGLTRSLGIEYADKGIRVNSISPGLIETPQVDSYFKSLEDPEEARNKERELLPCKRIGRPEEVANTAVFLASDEALFINASDILIDGGRSQIYCD